MIYHPGIIQYSKIIGSVDKDSINKYFRRIAVKDKTLTATNGHILIRSPLDAPDGVYSISPQMSLVPAPFEAYDIESIENLGKQYVIGKRIAQTLTKSDRSQMALAAQSTIDDGCRDSFPAFGSFFQARYIVWGLTELSRYEDVHLLERNLGHDPAVLGLNWGSCVVIMPLKGMTHG